MVDTLHRNAALTATAFLSTLAGVSCGTIQTVSSGCADGAFPGVRYDLATITYPDKVAVSREDDMVSGACTGMCFTIPAVIYAAAKLVDVPLSFLADLGWMGWHSIDGKAQAPVPQDSIDPLVSP